MEKPHRARKRFGQNFLHDGNIIGRMLQSIAARDGDQIVEIGPGQGALTYPLLEQLGKLTAIELDRDLITQLKLQALHCGDLTLHQGDALKFDFSTLGSVADKLRIVGNLPYNISTPILFHLAEHSAVIQDMHVLLQKEVAQRIAAAPGGGDYGKLSIMMQVRFQTQLLFDVLPGAFHPPPKVKSTFIRLTPHAEPLIESELLPALNQVVSAAFSQRRKTLRNTLKPLFSAAQLEQLGIDPAKRAETLMLSSYLELARLLARISHQDFES